MMPTSRYLVTKLGNGDHVIADSREMGSPLLYLLQIRYADIEGQPWNTKISLGSFDARSRVGHKADDPDIEIERVVWTSVLYLRRESAARSLGPKILQALEREEIEIDHPHELAYKFGGNITR
jgi:hypothetical protein